jgi:hypothetical protein
MGIVAKESWRVHEAQVLECVTDIEALGLVWVTNPEGFRQYRGRESRMGIAERESKLNREACILVQALVTEIGEQVSASAMAVGEARAVGVPRHLGTSVKENDNRDDCRRHLLHRGRT